MADRFWEQRTTRQHTYIDEQGRIIGAITLRLSTKSYEAFVYDKLIGEYIEEVAAQLAVEGGCVEVEALRAAEAQRRENAASVAAQLGGTPA